MNLPAFLEQADAYRESDDVADSVFKVLNLLGTTHPFFVLRVGELRTGSNPGAYDRILRGEYPRRGDPEPEYVDDLKAAGQSYRKEAEVFVDDLADGRPEDARLAPRRAPGWRRRLRGDPGFRGEPRLRVVTPGSGW
jgi:hypothetical protein